MSTPRGQKPLTGRQRSFVIGVDRAVYWFSRHWLAVFNVLHTIRVARVGGNRHADVHLVPQFASLVAGDANGDCIVNITDVTKLVAVFRLIGTTSYCPDYPPVDPMPSTEPPGWPNCDP